MKSLGFLIILSLLGITVTEINDGSVYQFEPDNIDGEVTPLSNYEGKVLLIVNTASKCGFTPQYEGLQALYEKYKDRGLIVMGFPANNFGGQEPGTDEEIKQFCRVNFDVGFPMFSKVSVKGEDIHPLFDYLTNSKETEISGEIKWNFEKFLVDRNGNLINRFRSKVKPQSDELLNAIDQALNS